MTKVRLYSYLIMLISASFNSSAQKVTPASELDYTINEFTLPGGRLGNNVNSIVEGPLGFLWFGSHGGLHRYDGHDMITYDNKIQDSADLSKSLSFPYIEGLHWARDTTLWICTWGNGLYHFDPFVEEFTHYPSVEGDESTISHPKAQCVIQDKKGYIWVGTEIGLNKFDPTTRKVVKRYFHDPDDPYSLPFDNISSLYIDRQGKLWIGSGFAYFLPPEGGLSQYDPDKDHFINYREEEGNNESLWTSAVRGIYEDAQGNFWVGTTKALHLMNREKGTFQRMSPSVNAPFAPGTNERKDPAVFSIIEDGNQNLWVGSIGGELTSNHLLRYNLKTKKTTLFPIGISVWHLCASRDGSVWVASASIDGQILRISPKKKKINSLITEGLSFVRAYYQSPDYLAIIRSGIDPNAYEFADLTFDETRNCLWLLSRFDETDSTYNPILYGYFLDDGRISAEIIPLYTGLTPRTNWELTAGLDVDSRGILWGGTHDLQSAVFSYNPATKEVELFRNNPNNPNSLSSNEVTNLFVDSKDRVWVGTYGKGLNKIDSRNGFVTRYNLYEDEYENQNNNIPIAFTEDADGNIWIAGNLYEAETNTTIVKLNPTNDQMSTYRLDEEYNFERISSLAVSSQSNQVALTFDDTGMGVYNLEDGVFTFLSPTTNNFPFATGANVVVDENGTFWMNAQYVNLVAHFDSLGRIRTIETEHKHAKLPRTGLLANNGKFYYLGTMGPEEIDPAEVVSQDADVYSFIQITDLDITGNRVISNAGSILKRPMVVTQTMDIPHNVNNFTLSFSDFDFKTERKEYTYRLRPIQEHWVTSQSSLANFYKLPAGRYDFEVKNQHGLVDRLSISVQPPWWSTWWAYVLYGLIILLAGWLIQKTQKERTIRIEREKTKDRELAQAKEIEKAYNQLEETHSNLKATQAQLIHAEKMASLGELTAGIAHEIQNPLNFVNNFSEVSGELLEEIKEELEDGNLEVVDEIVGDLKQNLEKINHHGYRASNIVQGMLAHSRASSSERELADINQLVDEYLRLAYHGFRAKDNGFKATFEARLDEDLPKIKIASQDIGRVLLNLINNAFYACAEKTKTSGNGYVPKVTVTTAHDDRYVKVSVQDNGPGISSEIREKIFQPFFTTKPTGSGTGLGLSLSYDIVKAHGGELKVLSEDGKGTTFVLELPKSTAI